MTTALRTAAAAIAAMLLAPAAHADPAPGATHDRELSQGYAELYEAVSGLRWLEALLAIKFESEETHRVVSDLAHDAAGMKGELEAMAREYPSLSLKDDGLPALERRKRELMERDRAKSLAPIVGAKGADFERTLLLSQSGALNQLRFLAAALEEAERGSPREAQVARIRERLDRHYVAVVRLLDRRFFRAPAHSPTGEA